VVVNRSNEVGTEIVCVRHCVSCEGRREVRKPNRVYATVEGQPMKRHDWTTNVRRGMRERRINRVGIGFSDVGPAEYTKCELGRALLFRPPMRFFSNRSSQPRYDLEAVRVRRGQALRYLVLLRRED
jgi:hypothetical protein